MYKSITTIVWIIQEFFINMEGDVIRQITSKRGVPVVAQWSTNPTRNLEISGSIPDLAQWVKDLALP